MSDTQLLAVLTDIRTWIRAAAYSNVKTLLQEILVDGQSRQAYQMCDGANSRDTICKVCRMGKNTLPALQSRCIASGLMMDKDGRKIRLFDLTDFGLLDAVEPADSEGEADRTIRPSIRSGKNRRGKNGRV